MGLEKQGGNPTGNSGKIFGLLMNIFHTSIYKKHYLKNLPDDNSTILDIGCGGGKFLKFMGTVNSSYFLKGIDHSQEMVLLSQKVLKNEIAGNRAEISLGEAEKINTESYSVDLVTSHETVQFWDNIDLAFSEIYRVLKDNGRITIMNRFPKLNTYWWKIAKIKSENEYKSKLEKAGFSSIITDMQYKKGWIVIFAKK